MIAWQGGSGHASKAQPALPSAPSGPAGAAVAPLSSAKETHTATAAAPFQHLIASCVQPFKSPVVADGVQPKQQPKSGWKSSSTARTVPTPVGLGAGLGCSKQKPSSCSLQASLPQPAAAELDAATAVEDEPHGRESLGGTQGAITGLTHMALQKHNDAMPAASAGASVESQGLGMQACSCYCCFLIVMLRHPHKLDECPVFLMNNHRSLRRPCTEADAAISVRVYAQCTLINSTPAPLCHSCITYISSAHHRRQAQAPSRLRHGVLACCHRFDTDLNYSQLEQMLPCKGT